MKRPGTTFLRSFSSLRSYNFKTKTQGLPLHPLRSHPLPPSSPPNQMIDSPLGLLARTASIEFLSRHGWSRSVQSSALRRPYGRRMSLSLYLHSICGNPETFGWREMPRHVAARALALWTMGMLRALPELAAEEADPDPSWVRKWENS